MFPRANSACTVRFTVDKDISASFFRGSVSIDDSQKSRMLGKGVQFSIWQYGDGKALLWNANTWISTSSEKKSFEVSATYYCYHISEEHCKGGGRKNVTSYEMGF
mmetsp:Transcript_8329/g.13221  ORF Transcript_8329/g.13221 Transcript_8329/m.13221 type:complete len:105 (+) Transcript_8329:204-518(+)